MRKTKLIIAACIFAFYSSTASANWQYTKWCMSQEQVKAAAPGTVIALTPREQIVDSVADSHNIALLKTPYSSGGYQFDAIFSFDKSKTSLASVKLKLVNLDRAAQLFDSLCTKYGQPTKEKKSESLSYAFWYTAEDQIVYISIGDKMVSVNYLPRNTEDNNGL